MQAFFAARNKSWFRIALVLGYAGLLWILWEGIVVLEAFAQNTYYSTIVKRRVSKVARLPLDRCLLGVYKPELPYSFERLRSLERRIGKRFTLISLYQAWGDGPENRFPASLVGRIAAAEGLGQYVESAEDAGPGVVAGGAARILLRDYRRSGFHLDRRGTYAAYYFRSGRGIKRIL